MKNKIKKLDKKSKLLIQIIAISLFITIVTTSYAFFTANIIANTTQSVITTGSMRLEFNDGQLASAENMTPGTTITKTFKVKNIGDLTTSYDIFFSEMINTFIDKNDLVYTIESETGCSNTSERVVPGEVSELSKIVSTCVIEPNVEHEYSLNLTFKDDGTNQDDNKGRIFSTKISINEYNVSEGLQIANNYIEEANRYFNLNSSSNTLGTNLASNLNVDNKQDKDQVVITKNGDVELAIARNNVCFRKNANSDKLEVIDLEYCDVNVAKFVSNNGALHVSGSKLLNERNEEFRITGASMGGGATLPDINSKEFTEEAFSTLRKWGGNAIRVWIAGKSEYNGAYHYIGNEEEYLQHLFTAIDNAIANDIYVVVVWGSADENDDPLNDKAIEAFTAVANHYPNDKHIIYELWNEPHGSTTWSDIKNYSNSVIPQIRSISPDSVIIVGTPDYSKKINVVIGDQLNFSNIMYTHHMYMASMTQENIGYLKEAIDANIPIFVSEWSGTDNPQVEYLNYINEAQAYSYIRLLNKYNISHIGFCFHGTNWVYGFTNNKDWTEELPNSTLKQNGLFFKKIFRDDYSTDKYLMRENQSSSDTYKASAYKNKIISVSFKNKIEIPDNAVVTWDLSATSDGTIIGYLMNSTTSGMYDLIICANGYVNLPNNSGSLFAGLENVESYDFEYARTDLLNNLSYAFRENKKIKEIDLSNFDTSKLTFMYATFANDEELESINFNNWSPKLSGFSQAFMGCKKLTYLDLSKFDVSKVDNFLQLFYNAYSLTKLNISTWSPNKVSSMNLMFKSNKNIKEIDLSGFKTFKDGYNINDIFNDINPNVIIKTGNEEFKTTMQNAYPSLNIQ